MTRESKTLSFQVEAKGVTTDENGSEFGLIEAYGAVFNNVDEGGDRILPGAFKRTIAGAKSRAQAREKKYLLPMLWNHSPDDLIGGWHDLSEDTYGLKCSGEIALATQRGREYYELAKAGMSDQFSIVYDPPDVEWVKGGAGETSEHRRDLKEIRLYSVDPVTFAMNEETRLVGVKSIEGLEDKAVCGNTSGPIGPRDESWDGSAAEKQIWAAAYNEDTKKINVSLAKKYFMNCDGDAQQKGSYGYPFWYVGSSPHICVGAVKAIAGAIQGARGASAPSGMKAKVKTLYGRINSKYPDATPLEVPWASTGEGGKAASFRSNPFSFKTFAEHFAEEMNEDLLEDWQDVFLCALSCAVLDAFKIGDSIESDIEDALAAFHDAVMNWVAQGIEYGLTEYLISQAPEYNPADYTIQYGSESRPDYGRGYMSRRPSSQQKAMTAGDATTGGFLAKTDGGSGTTEHVSKLQKASAKAAKAIEDHITALRSAAEEVTTLIGGADQSVTGVKGQGAFTRKAGRMFSAANMNTLKEHASDLSDMADSHSKAMTRFTKSVNSIADDMATMNQGSEESFADDPGTPDEGRQEGKRLLRTPFLALTRLTNDASASSATHSGQTIEAQKRTRTTPTPSPSNEDTLTDEQIEAALGKLKALKAAKATTNVS